MSKTAKITEAKRLLKKREGEIAEGKLPGVYFDKVTFDALAKDLVTDYTVKGRDTLKRVKWSIDCLKESFEGMMATDITTDKVSPISRREWRIALQMLRSIGNWRS